MAGGVILAAIEGLNLVLTRVLMPSMEQQQAAAELGGVTIDPLLPPSDPSRPRISRHQRGGATVSPSLPLFISHHMCIFEADSPASPFFLSLSLNLRLSPFLSLCLTTPLFLSSALCVSPLPFTLSFSVYSKRPSIGMLVLLLPLYSLDLADSMRENLPPCLLPTGNHKDSLWIVLLALLLLIVMIVALLLLKLLMNQSLPGSSGKTIQ